MNEGVNLAHGYAVIENRNAGAVVCNSEPPFRTLHYDLRYRQRQS